MTESEYKQRKLELEAELNISIRFLRQGYEAQLRAMEQEWAREKRLAPEATVQQRASRPPGTISEQVHDAVAQLPEEFTKADIIHLLGFAPERSSLHRAIDELLVEKMVQIRRPGSGRTPNVYRKLGNTQESR